MRRSISTPAVIAAACATTAAAILGTVFLVAPAQAGQAEETHASSPTSSSTSPTVPSSSSPKWATPVTSPTLKASDTTPKPHTPFLLTVKSPTPLKTVTWRSKNGSGQWMTITTQSDFGSTPKRANLGLLAPTTPTRYRARILTGSGEHITTNTITVRAAH